MKRLFIGGLLVAALMLAGCGAQTSAEESSQSREVYAMDTVMTLEAYGQNADAALDEAVAEIERLDALWSIASSDGEIARLNAEKQITASADTLALLTRAKEISAATDGLFSTTIAPLMEAWGTLTTNRSRSLTAQSRSPPTRRWISAALPKASHRRG